MLAECIERGADSVHHERARPQGCHTVENQRQRHDMVEMRVSEEHVVDERHALQAQVEHAGAGVNEHVGASEKRRGAPAPTHAAADAKRRDRACHQALLQDGTGRWHRVRRA
jgi:hypothetical protein